MWQGGETTTVAHKTRSVTVRGHAAGGGRKGGDCEAHHRLGKQKEITRGPDHTSFHLTSSSVKRKVKKQADKKEEETEPKPLSGV